MPDSTEPRNASPELHLQLLGGFSVQVDGTTIPEAQWKSRRARSLVKLLALAPGHRLHRDQAIDALWPEADLSAAANSLHQTLHAARRILDPLAPGCLTLDEGSLSLSGGGDRTLSVDVEQFEAAAAQAKKAQDAQAYQSALALYSGELLPEDRYEEWTLQRREGLHQVYLQLLLGLAQLQETRRDYPAAIETLLRLLAADPSHEDGHAGLMRLYAANGQRQQALRQYELLCKALQTELDAEPSAATQALYEAIQSGQLEAAIPVLLPATPVRRHNLPAQLSSFIGREREIGEVSQLVSEQRLVTLTGSGGTGKTRLALRAVDGLLENFADGVFFVELAPLSDPDLVPQVCAQTLELVEQPNISVQDSLTHYLEKKHLLLILDNCEHVIAVCTRLVDSLLKACPSLHILATSREILSIPGEAAFRVPPLTAPDPRHLPPLEALAQYEAVRLFVERAAQASPGIALNEANAGAVAQICQRLDGIPLAIELAAARARLLSIEQIAARLGDAFRLLTGGSRAVLPRHQTLKAMIDWSYEQLSAKERLLLQRLSVFAGGWTLEAAEGVCADGDENQACQAERIDTQEVIDLLAQLTDKSLVNVELHVDRDTRYRLLEIIRQYGRDRLMESGCSQVVRERHLGYYAQFTGQAEPHLRGKGQLEWLERLDQELDNLRVALEWSLESNIDPGRKILADMFWFWHIRSYFREGADWAKKFLDEKVEKRSMGSSEQEHILQRARVLRITPWMDAPFKTFIKDHVLIMLEESVLLMRKLGPSARHELAISLFFLDAWFKQSANPEMLEIFRQENDRSYINEFLFYSSQWALDQGNLAESISYCEQSLAICREIEDIDGIGGRTGMFSYINLIAGNYTKAEVLAQECLEIFLKMRNWRAVITTFINISAIALAEGNYARARYFIEEAYSIAHEWAISIIDVSWWYGKIAWAQADTDRLAQISQEILSELGEKIWPFLIVKADDLLAMAAVSQNDLVQAEIHIRKAISLIEPLWGVDYKASILRDYGALLWRKGLLLESLRIYGAIHSQPYIMGQSPRQREEDDLALKSVRAALGEEAFTVAWEEGKAMTLEQALAYALGEPKTSPPTPLQRKNGVGEGSLYPP